MSANNNITTMTNNLKEDDEDYYFPFTEPDKKNITTKKYRNKFIFISQKLNKKKKRKEKLDNIFKKIKCKFFRKIKKIINAKLLKANSKFLFESFPQTFIADITKKNNSKALQKTYEELFEYSYNLSNNKKKLIEKKRNKNEKTLEYLNSEHNTHISEKSVWNKIKKMKYSELFEKFLISKEFEDSIKELEKTETESYIYQYINLAENFIDYFKETKTLNKSENNNIQNNTNISPVKEKDEKIEIVIENISKPKEPEIKKENEGIFIIKEEINFDRIFTEENLNNHDDDKIDDIDEGKSLILSDLNEELIYRNENNFSFCSDIGESLYFIKSN